MKDRSVLAALGCAAMVLAGSARAADDKGSASLEEARQHAAKAKVHYDLGEFEKAAEEYTQVYRIRPIPALLFNIAQSWRQAGQYEKARQFYKAYLRESPDAKNSSAVKNALKEIDELLAKEKRTREVPPTGVRDPPSEIAGRGPPIAAPAAAAAAVKPAAPAPMPAPPAAAPAPAPASVTAPIAAAQPEPAVSRPAAPMLAVTASPVATSAHGYRTWSYVSAGAAAVLIGGGLAFAAKASKYEDELNARPHPQATVNDLSSTAKSSKTMAAVLLGAGAMAAVGAGVLFFVPTGSGAAMQGRF